MQAPLLLLASALLATATAAAAESEAERLAALLGLAPGMRVADVGAGEGELALDFAARVGAGGRVYATELEAEQRDEIRAAAAEAGLANVEVIEAEVEATGLPTACCDAILLRHVYHHLTEPAAVGRDLLRALEPGARLVIVDFPPTWYLRPFTPEGVGEERSRHGIEPETALAELLALGFEKVAVVEPFEESWLGPDSYAVVVRRPEGSER
jgi:ubiquinone/menaquinone biosynthesis C-methylase UbiE